MGLIPLPSVILWGYPAALVSRTMRTAAAAGRFDRLHPSDRRKLAQLLEDLGAAEQAWLEHQRNGRTATPETETGPSSEAMTVIDASTVLNVGARRVRQLAADGLGSKHGGRWRLNRAAVLAEAAARSERS